MDIERWKRIEQLFEAALAQPEDRRTEFLREACPEDPDIRAEVEGMLKVGRTGEVFLDTPPLEALAQRRTLQEGDHIGCFEILSLLGRGGMGEVYRAKDLRLQREVAIKVLTSDLAQGEASLRRIQREARSASQLNHPNILTVFDIGDAAGLPYIVTELLPGATLQQLLASGPLPMNKALHFAHQLASGLEAAHGSGVIHRDIKPANLAITQEDFLKILDFGLAKLANPDGGTPSTGATLDSSALAAQGLILGTPSYMAPEQVRQEPADKRVDTWAFGLVLWEMITGKRLFDAASNQQILAAVLHQQIDLSLLPAKTPPAVAALLARCLERDANRRLRDIGEARIVLEKLLTTNESVAFSPRFRYRHVWIPAAAILFIGIASLAIIHLREPSLPHQRVEYQINPPPGSVIDFQISPDGRYLASLTGVGSLAFRLWVRSLESLETRLLTEVHYKLEDSYCLSWSRDSQFIIVAEADQLNKFPLGGGPPIALGSFSQRFHGCAWLDTGDLLLTTDTGLLRLPSSGGKAVPIGLPDSALPTPLPSGRALFVRRLGGPEGRDDGIYAASLDGRPPIQILPGGTAPQYAPPPAPGGPGTLLFLRGDALWAQPFDADRLKLRGDPVMVAQQIPLPAGNTLGRRFTASSTGVLIYRAGESRRLAELAWLDRSGKRLETLTGPFARISNNTVRLSPDNTRAIVPVPQSAQSDQIDLWIADFARKMFSRFTFHGAVAGIWSPDGKKVLWIGDDQKYHLAPVGGSGEDRSIDATPLENLGYPGDWSSDGSLIALHAVPKKFLEIWLLPAKGGRQSQPYIQTDHAVAWGQFSPNGRWMAYTEYPSPRPPQVIVESIPAGAKRWQVSTDGGDWPIWRRDGKELFYSNANQLMSVAVHESEGLVEFGTPRKLFDFQAVASRFQVSRDGQRFLVAMPAENSYDRAPFTVDTDFRAGIALKH